MTKIGCSACEGGQVFVYLKNEDIQRVHIAVLPCGVCNSDSSQRPESLEGGVKIDEREFKELYAMGWTDPDI
ncbi:MAG: hypothetical protein UW75_C0029G0002 [Parcubacteria group bacterium GW2011_GWF2_44_8]|nr:MAG: hypothetical protein UW75_C0029G0002 [Parcubacteria group bacterium GW2011_GWF2_44_8]